MLSSDKYSQVATALLQAGVSLRCDTATYEALANLHSKYKDQISRSTDEDYDTEFLDLTMAVKAVDDVTETIDHIIEHGSKHTDCIITEDASVAEYFMARVDAAGCYWNASTRFADGFRYGFGAEVGVSTTSFVKVIINSMAKFLLTSLGFHQQDTCTRPCRFGGLGNLQVSHVW